PVWLADGSARFVVTLAPGEQRPIEVEVRLHGAGELVSDGIAYRSWRERFQGLPLPAGREDVVRRSIDDLRALLLFTEDGPYPAAGIPWFVAAFGRDALLAAAM